MQHESYLQRLAEIVGTENVVWDPQQLRPCGWEGPLPQAVVHPPGPEQVAEVMKLACAERLNPITSAKPNMRASMGGLKMSRPLRLLHEAAT